MSKEKVSIIIPTYNVDNYIDKCITSVLNQDYTNIEIIIIDDASTDNTYKKILKYKKNKNISIYKNDTNKGQAYTRNFGLNKATGNFISFIDSDDFIPENFISSLIKSMHKYHSDIAVCDIVYLTKFSKERKNCGKEDKKSIINNPFAASPCNKIYKKELFDKDRFPEGKINEDIGLIIPMLVNNKLSYTENTYYNYVQRDESTQNSKISIKSFDVFDTVKMCIKKMNDEEYTDAIIFNQIILFHLYSITKVNGFFNRYRYLKMYRKRTKELVFRSNKTFISFLKDKKRIIKIYYKILYNLNRYNLILFENFIIELYNFYKRRKKVTKKVDINDIKTMAKYQSSLKSNDKTISVVIPNYNYANYLLERVYSVLYQNYRIKELIILDDCSIDGSTELIRQIEEQIKKFIDIKVIINEINSGSSFKQWQKGFENATGDYVWIAEADDYCEKNFLKKLVKRIDEKVIISYSNTAYINSNGEKIVDSIFKAIDINKTNHWKKSYINEGEYEFSEYAFLNCTIPNVSSTIIKNGNYKDEFKLATEYKQAGDWLFYSLLMHKGKIAYTPYVFNFYREHGGNVSSTFNKKKHLDEISKIHNFFIKKYNLGNDKINKIKERQEFLKKTWNL